MSYKNTCTAIHEKTTQKQRILEEMKQQGLRITTQRSLVIDIILSKECTCSKEIYYRANKMDPSIGIATVYRMLKTLEEIGVIDRKNIYKVAYETEKFPIDNIELELANQNIVHISKEDMREAIELLWKSRGIHSYSEIKEIFHVANSSLPKVEIAK